MKFKNSLTAGLLSVGISLALVAALSCTGNSLEDPDYSSVVYIYITHNIGTLESDCYNITCDGDTSTCKVADSAGQNISFTVTNKTKPNTSDSSWGKVWLKRARIVYEVTDGTVSPIINSLDGTNIFVYDLSNTGPINVNGALGVTVEAIPSDSRVGCGDLGVDIDGDGVVDAEEAYLVATLTVYGEDEAGDPVEASSTFYVKLSDYENEASCPVWTADGVACI